MGRIATFVWIVTTCSIIVVATPLRAQVTPEASACGYLAGLIDKASPSGPLFLPSYPTVESGPLHGAAYLYDNAVAAIALVGCGEQDKAYRIGSAILWAIDNDRTWHDGRLRNAYAAGVVANGSAKLPGWWDNTQNKWLEDRYQVGSDNGNMAWAMLALLSIDDVNTGSRFRDGAARLGNGPTRAALAVSRAVRLGTSRRPMYGHGSQPNTILTSPPRLAFLQPAPAIRAGVIWQQLLSASSIRCGIRHAPVSQQAPPKTASRAIRFWHLMLKSGP